MKSLFEEAIEKTAGVPVGAAASFFIEVRHFERGVPSSMSKTAGWQDPPDETGELEGQYAAAPEQVVSIMGKCATMLLRLMNAKLIYSASVRGPYASAVKNKLHEWEDKCAFEDLVQRMATLAGPAHIGEPEPPPASTNAEEIIKRIIRAEQELVACFKELAGLCGDNPFGHQVEHWMLDRQRNISDLWQCIDPANDAATTSSALGVVEEPVDPEAPALPEIPEELAAPAEEEVPEDDELAAEELPAEEPEEEEKAASVKLAIRGLAFSPGGHKREAALDRAKEEELLLRAAAAQAKGTAGYLGDEGELHPQKGLTVTPSRIADVNALTGARVMARRAALHEKGENPINPFGGMLTPHEAEGPGGSWWGHGRVQKTAAPITNQAELDAAVRDQVLKGQLSAVQGAVRGQSMARHQRGERMGDVAGRLGGLAAGGLVGKRLGGGLGALGGAGLGMLAGGKLGKEVGKEVDVVREHKLASVAERMAQRVKLAQEPAAAEAPMASPTDNTELQPANYLQAEQMGQAAQSANEINFFRQKAQAAMQQAMQAVQQSQMQGEQLQGQMMELQQRADAADASVREALSEATSARDEALSQTQQAANMRMGMQKLRQQMIEVASQDPAAVAAAEMDAVAQGSKNQVAMQAQEQAAAEAADAGMVPPPGPEGPAGQAPSPATPPGAAPAAGAPDMNANAGGPPGAAAGGGPGGAQEPQSQVAPKQASVKTAGLLGAGAGAAIGGGLGLKRSAELAGSDPQALRDRVQVLEETQDGSYGQAANLAKAKKTLADSELAQAHPRGFGLRATARGAALGGIRGSAVETAVRQGVNPAAVLNTQRQAGRLANP